MVEHLERRVESLEQDKLTGARSVRKKDDSNLTMHGHSVKRVRATK